MPLRVEAQAAFLALIHYLPRYGDVILEVDCAELITLTAFSSSLLSPDIHMLRTLMLSRSLPFVHTPRETNEPAHLLAQLALPTQTFTSYDSFASLPSSLRGSIITGRALPTFQHSERGIHNRPRPS